MVNTICHLSCFPSVRTPLIASFFLLKRFRFSVFETRHEPELPLDILICRQSLTKTFLSTSVSPFSASNIISFQLFVIVLSLSVYLPSLRSSSVHPSLFVGISHNGSWHFWLMLLFLSWPFVPPFLFFFFLFFSLLYFLFCAPSPHSLCHLVGSPAGRLSHLTSQTFVLRLILPLSSLQTWPACLALASFH